MTTRGAPDRTTSAIASPSTSRTTRDIDAKAPTHVLVIPRAHVASLDAATDAAMLGALQLAAAAIARSEGIAASGYRTVINSGPDAGQTVFHVHLHLLGGRKLGWPPG